MTKKPHAADAKPTKKTHKAKTGAARPAAEAAVAGSAAQPLFADIQNLLDTLVPPSDANIDSAPHQRFWRKAPTNTRDGFVNFETTPWQQPGRLVSPGNPDSSNLYFALAGKSPFDGSQQNQMPDVNADFSATLATADQLDVVATWIKNGAPP
jgi:hypothetical protein